MWWFQDEKSRCFLEKTKFHKTYVKFVIFETIALEYKTQFVDIKHTFHSNISGNI